MMEQDETRNIHMYETPQEVCVVVEGGNQKDKN